MRETETYIEEERNPERKKGGRHGYYETKDEEREGEMEQSFSERRRTKSTQIIRKRSKIR